MAPPIVFVHGRGKNVDPLSWVDALRESIRQAGHTPPAVDNGDFITVSYTDLLESTSLPTARMPAVTLPKVDDTLRDAFLNEAAALRTTYEGPHSPLNGQQLVELLEAVVIKGVPLAHIPLQDRGLVEIISAIMGDVARYRTNTDLRASVLDRLLTSLPDVDEIILVGHSLGSVVVVDLLSYLPERLEVPLLLTLGSPLSYRCIRDIGLPGIATPLGFPHRAVHRWVNLVEPRDIVTGFTGLQSWWPEVVDIGVKNPPGHRHGIRPYLGHPEVGELVGQARGVGLAPATLGFELDRTLEQDKQESKIMVEVAMHYARILLESEDSASVRERCRFARKELFSMVGESLDVSLSIDGCEAATHSWRDRSAIIDRMILIVRLSFSNPFEPFEPGVSDSAQRRGLKRLAHELGIPDADDAVDDLLDLKEATQKAVLPRSKTQLAKPFLVGVSTIGLVAFAAPAAVGLFAAAGAGGAAALTSGLAAMGGGGMIAGIGVIGGAGAGSGLLVSQLARSGTDREAVAANLVALGTTVRWLRRWGDDSSARKAAGAADGLPRLLADYASQLTFHAGKSAEKSEPVVNLQSSVRQTERLMAWLNDTIASDRDHRTPPPIEN